jgi:hypothetical protein
MGYRPSEMREPTLPATVGITCSLLAFLLSTKNKWAFVILTLGVLPSISYHVWTTKMADIDENIRIHAEKTRLDEQLALFSFAVQVGLDNKDPRVQEGMLALSPYVRGRCHSEADLVRHLYRYYALAQEKEERRIYGL